MTTADPVVTDAELVSGVLAGDQIAFAQVYDRYADRLFDFAHSMLRNREDAADAVADTFVTVAEKLTQLREPSLLRPWLYSVTRRECLRRLEARKKIAFDGEDRLVVMADEDLGPDGRAEAEELRRLVWDAATGLNDRDRAVLDLHLRQGLDGAELAAALDVKPQHAYTMMNRLRGQLERSLGALLIARLGRDDCDELDDLLSDWDGTFSPLVRKRVARHVDDCDVCTKRRALIVNPWAAFAAIAPLAAPAELRERVLDGITLVAHPTRPWWRRHLLAAIAALVVVGGIVAVAVLWPATGDSSDEPDPTPTATPTASSSPEPSESPTDEPLGPRLALSGGSVDVSRAAQGVVVSNTGDEDLTFTATPSAGWVTVAPTTGTVAPGDSTRVVIDRRDVDEGRSTAQVTITSNGGSGVVTVSANIANPPGITDLAFGSTGCSVPLTATVLDESTVTSVSVRWSGPSTGSTTLQQSGNGWVGNAAPIVFGTYTFRVTATDELGATAARDFTRALDPCPG